MGTPEEIGWELFNMNSAITAYEVQTGAWPSANLAIFVPMPIASPFIATQMWVVNGATVSGNIDVGIYDIQGNRLVSIGSTAQAGTTSNQTFNITDTLLSPAVYYLAVALDNATGIVWHFAHPANNARMMGTYAAMAQAYIPEVFVTGQTVI
jgi:hypothetical protein